MPTTGTQPAFRLRRVYGLCKDRDAGATGTGSREVDATSPAAATLLAREWAARPDPAFPSPMRQLPLLFSFRQVVQGRGFLAGVAMSGRALMEEGPIETWISGVAPVGLAGGGADRSTAFTDFCKAWAEILFDIADEAESFADFRRETETFLSSSQADLTAEWESVLAEVRRTGYVDPSLKQETAERPIAIELVELTPTAVGPDANCVEAGLLAAA